MLGSSNPRIYSACILAGNSGGWFLSFLFFSFFFCLKFIKGNENHLKLIL